jgi:hypothetical protein
MCPSVLKNSIRSLLKRERPRCLGIEHAGYPADGDLDADPGQKPIRTVRERKSARKPRRHPGQQQQPPASSAQPRQRDPISVAGWAR